MSQSRAGASKEASPDRLGHARVRERARLEAIPVPGEVPAIPDALVEAIADRVAVRLADIARDPVRLYDTRAVARMLAVSEDWVRDHAAELGAIRVGDSPRGPLRFDVDRVRTALAQRRLQRTERAPAKRRGRRTTTASGVKLLPLPEEAA
jgi:hypothetical protein